ncbi:MAG: PAS domain S-box protein [Planctomycetales bacterium]|nr:PAS domain S-box protein [bacterium]UNM08021.1 MAG: PAS domain S-box protein [Planctomycetales bacterium]
MNQDNQQPPASSSTALPIWLVWFTVILCILPTALNLLGFDFGSDPDTALHGIPNHGGVYAHTLLEWTSFSLALLIATLSFINYRITRDPVVLLIGSLLFWSGCLDAFHILVSDGLMATRVDPDLLSPLTWFGSRMFNATVTALGALALLWLPASEFGRSGPQHTRRVVVWLGSLFGILLWLIMFWFTRTSSLPAEMFPDNFVKRPLDLLPLLIYIVCAALLLPLLYRRRPGVFIHALWLSMLPNIFVQLHSSFGAAELYDNHFNIAHGLKIVAYGVPLAGLALEYIRTYYLVESRLSEGTLEQEASQRQLTFSENRLKAVLDNAAEAIITINEIGVIQDFNLAAVDMFGYTRDEVIGNNVSMLMPQRTAIEHDSYIDAHLSTGVSKIIGIGREIIARRSDGTEFFANLAVSKVQVGAGYLFTGIIHDIDERKRAELNLKQAFAEIERSAREQALSREQLALSEDRLKAVLDNAAEAIITINERGVIQDFNLAAIDMFGYTRGQVIGNNVAMLMPSRTAVEHDDYIDAHLRTGVSKIIGIGREIIARRIDGREFFANLAVSKVQVGDGYLFTGIIHDIDERKRAEISLKQAYEDLEVSNRELDEFAYIASHDLKEPLRGISNYAQFLLEDYNDRLDEPGREMLRTLPRLTGNLDKLLSELLEYSRVGRVDLAREQVDLQEVLSEVLDSLHVVLRERGTRVSIPRPLPVAFCDRSRVSEVFRNLVSNAMKYNDKQDPWIEVGFVEDAELGIPVFYVEDNGIGIEEEFHEKIWVIFKRLHGKQKYGGGTGVGLSIVKKIIERHDGVIWIESQPGIGTRFNFTFGSSRPNRSLA